MLVSNQKAPLLHQWMRADQRPVCCLSMRRRADLGNDKRGIPSLVGSGDSDSLSPSRAHLRDVRVTGPDGPQLLPCDQPAQFQVGSPCALHVGVPKRREKCGEDRQAGRLRQRRPKHNATSSWLNDSRSVAAAS